jgi:hypothetical protein
MAGNKKAGEREEAVGPGAQKRKILLLSGEDRQHQAPKRSARKVAHTVDQSECHMHLAECSGAGCRSDQQHEQPIASVLNEGARR